MLELNHIHLRNFGPPDARYEQVDLDLSGTGEPIAEPALFDEAAEGGHAQRRPSPASLLLLPNGGGKGILLHALKSTITPYRHRDNESLRKFTISNRQPTHVVLEWADRRNGQLLVTAQIMTTDSKGELSRLFYTFRPGPQLKTSQLPFIRDGKWTSYEDYVSFLRQLRTDSVAEFDSGEGLDAWEHLQARLGLVPDLFAIQWKMNISEGAAGDAFARNSGGHFIEWLLRQVADTDRYQGLSERFTNYCREIDNHDSLRTQHQYATTMRQRCQSVDEAYKKHRHAQGDADNAGQLLADLNASIIARQNELTFDIAELQATKENIRTQKEEAETVHDLARRRRSHVVSCELEMKHKELTARIESEKTDVADAEVDSRAWPAVTIAINRQAASNDLHALQQMMSAAEDSLAAAQQRLHTAAARVRLAYTQALEAMDHDATKLEGEIKQWQSTTVNYRKEWHQLHTLITRTETEAAGHQRLIQQATAELEHARDVGHIGSDEDASDALARLTEATKQAKQALLEAEGALEEAQPAAEEARRAADTKTIEATEASRLAADLQRELSHHRTTAGEILAGGLVSELSETDQRVLANTDALTWLDEHAEDLTDRCRESIAAAEQEKTQPRRNAEEAQRLLSALSTPGGLLPPRPAVRSVCALLDSKGIAAVSGWQWLRDNQQLDMHEEIIRAHPELVDGVIVNTTADVQAAKRELEEADLLPPAAVVIAASDTFGVQQPGDDRLRTLPRPTPAMHDEQEASRECERVTEWLEEANDRLAELNKRIATYEHLDRDLSDWHRGLGGKSADTLIEHATAAAERATQLHEQAEVATTEAEARAHTLANAKTHRRDAAERAPQLQRITDHVERVVNNHIKAAQAQRDIDAIDTDNQRRHQQITTLQHQVEAAEAEHERVRDELTKLNVRISSFQTERDTIPHFTEAEGDIAHPSETLPALPELKADYDLAHNAYREASIGSVLRDQVAEAQQRLTDLQQQWGRQDASTQERAEQLRHDARAADPTQRRLAYDDALARERDANERLQQVEHEAAVVTERRKNARPGQGRSRWLEDHEHPEKWTPTDTDDADRLITSADDQIASAESTIAHLKPLLSQHQRDYTEKEKIAQRFNVLAATTAEASDGLSTDADVTACTESIDVVETQVKDAIELHKRYKTTLKTATHTLQVAVNAMQLANEQSEFTNIEFDLKRQIAHISPEQLPILAADWVEAFDTFTATLLTDLRQADNRRNDLVEIVTTHVRDAIQILKRAQRAARVPDGDSPWAGKPFLSIRFSECNNELIASSARTIVDRIARRHRKTKASGLDLVLASLREAVPNGFDVKILKPTPVGGMSMVPIDRMGKEFSGGQDLTGSILLYCVLAILKSADRTARNNGHGGPLFLDNPLGRANADYLMDLQFKIAKAMNVQLICTTPLSEDSAIQRFPLQIHMINDAAVREGTCLIRVASHTREQIAPPPHDPDRDAPPPTGLVGTAHLYRKDTQT